LNKIARALNFVAQHRPHRVTLGLAASAALFAMVAQAAETHAPAIAELKTAVVEAAAAAAPAAKPAYALVWDGRDVDGDGEADFANPTGFAVREHDDFGDGYFGASRDGGSRDHEGVDYVGFGGQDIHAPIAGQVTRMGYAYSDYSYKYVEITNPQTGYAARVFYVNPDVAIGETVALGEKIGTLKSLQTRYRGITDHVHLEVTRHGVRMDAGKVIMARWEREQSA
jgi:murein DD-endopeptidase MepM/ murein hydrolase activator NlpD